MPLRFEIKRKLSSRSDRVKGVDLHPTEPWVLACMYNGNVFIWNYNTQTMLKSFEVTELPVRAAKFVTRKQWIVTGSDDMLIRVYNYNTMEKLKTFEAHSDYIRSLAIHPTLPYVLSSSDDMMIKLWNWDKDWVLTQTFEGHSHYVMQTTFNPKDSNTFASASLDRTIKVWNIGSPNPNFTLEGHEKGVNCVDYFTGGERPFLISGADDKTVKVWDYQTKTCVQTLEGHSHNVSAVAFHPELPIILSGSEDGTVRLWHGSTYRLENTLNYGLERVWSIATLKGSHKVAMGYDEGTMVIKIGKEEPVASMDNGGKIIWAKHNEIQTVNTKSAADIVDGERLPLATKELGSCEVYPQFIKHSPNGRFVVVCGDGEYIIYTALAWRNKSFGSAAEFVWAADTGEYAIREGSSKVKIFKNFAERKSFKPAFGAEGMYGGALLALRGSEFVVFYEWEDCRAIRTIDVCPKEIYWSDNGELVTITTDTDFYILKYDRELVQRYLESGQEISEEGIEGAFEMLHEVGDRVRKGHWVGDCFIYTSQNGRLNYCVGGEIMTLFHLDRPMYLLGYSSKENRVYLIDKEHNVISYALLMSVLEYKTAIVRRDLEAAAAVLPSIPQDQKNKIARFLEIQGLKEMAMSVSDDPEHKFELAVQLQKLDVAYQICLESESEQKWMDLGNMALANNDMALAGECLKHAKDTSSLLLFHSANGDRANLSVLADEAVTAGQNNVAFVCLFLCNRLEECADLLINTGRIPEAALFVRTYLPSQISRVVGLWREDLATVNPKAAQALADPHEYPNLFPDLERAVEAEEKMKSVSVLPANAYPTVANQIHADVLADFENMDINATATPMEQEPVPAEAPVAVEEAPEPTPEPTPAPAPVPAAEEPAQEAAAPEPEDQPEPEPNLEDELDLDELDNMDVGGEEFEDIEGEEA